MSIRRVDVESKLCTHYTIVIVIVFLWRWFWVSITNITIADGRVVQQHDVSNVGPCKRAAVPGYVRRMRAGQALVQGTRGVDNALGRRQNRRKN